jgi:hypothetical protein
LSVLVSADVKSGMESLHPTKLLNILAPQVRFELTTLRLTAECSAIELLRSKACKGERENTKSSELCQPIFVIFTNLMNVNALWLLRESPVFRAFRSRKLLPGAAK